MQLAWGYNNLPSRLMQLVLKVNATCPQGYKLKLGLMQLALKVNATCPQGYKLKLGLMQLALKVLCLTSR